MRLLVCAAAAPMPPRSGFTLILEAVLAELRARHRVHVVAYRLPDQRDPTPPDAELVDIEERGPLHVAASLLRGEPRFVSRVGPDLRPTVATAVSAHRPDAVLVFSARLAGLATVLGDLPRVIVPVDAVHLGIRTRRLASRGPKRWLLGLEESVARRFERRAYRGFDRVVVVSEGDRSALLALDPGLPVDVIPNGVDLLAFAPDPGARRDSRRIVFTGVMDSPGNIVAAEFAAREVLPLVRAAVPDARLAIVGRDPAPRVRALADRPGVEVTGEVPAVRPWLTGSAAFLCPMVSGTGIKNKLLEAMAAGLPAVATPLGIGGLEVSEGHELLVGESPAALADHLVRLLTDDALAARIGMAGHDYVERHHGWPAIAARYEAALEAAKAARTGHTGGRGHEPATTADVTTR